MSGGKAVKCSLLTGIYEVGSWEGVVEQECDDTRLGHREDLRALKERLDQLAVVLGKSQVEVKNLLAKSIGGNEDQVKSRHPRQQDHERRFRMGESP